MSQAGFTPIQLYFSTTAAATPSAGNLANGELAINITDGRLFYKDNGGVVRVLAGTGGTGVVAGSNTQVQFNNNGVFGASANMVFNGTRLTVADLADSGLTSGRVTYASTGGALVDSANLTFDGTNLTASGYIGAGSYLNVSANAGYINFSGGGTASAPAGLSYGSFLNSGVGLVNFSAASQAFWANSAEQMRLTSTGLGIGTSSPTQKLTVLNSNGTYGVAYQPAVQIGNTSSGGTVSANTGLGALVWSTDGTATPVASIEAIRENPGSGAASGLAFRTGSSGGGTERMRLDSSGNLGLGVIPSATNTAFRAFEVGNLTVFSGTGGLSSYIDNNAFFNTSSQYIYKSSGHAGEYAMLTADGSHRWYTAPSGTAGNAISFTQAMTLNASGNLGVGTTSPSALRLTLEANGNQLRLRNTTTRYRSDLAVSATGTAEWNCFDDSGGVYMPMNLAGSVITFATGSGSVAERARIDSSGQLGLGQIPYPTTGGSYGSGSYGFLQVQTAPSALPTGDSNVPAGYSYGQFLGRDNIASWLLLRGPYASNSAKSGIMLQDTFFDNFGYGGRYIQASNRALTFGLVVNGTIYSSNAILAEQARFDDAGRFLLGATSIPASFGTTAFYVAQPANDYSAVFRSTTATAGNNYGVLVTYANGSPNGTSNEFLRATDSTALRFAVPSNGGVYNYQANNSNLSDRREKTNFAPAKSYLEAICAIPVQTFNYIDQNMEDDPGLTLGVVAQDVQAVAPELVIESNWGTEEEPKMRLSIYQTDLQYALMKCIQEQQAIINSLKARLDAANL
jgi:hypothetical protein